jgi:hypothetical protein
MRTIESYLPVFPGTYGTIFEDIDWEQIDAVGDRCTSFINGHLTDLGIVAVFQSVVSPKYYNFSNDSINVEYQFESLDKLVTYLIDNRTEFADYLKERYTSYDGFISHHSNDVDEWIQAFMFGGEIAHKLGSALEFYLTNENGDDLEYSMYEDLSGNGYVIYEDEDEY